MKCHCEERSDVALYQYPASYGSQVRLRCKPIARSLKYYDTISTKNKGIKKCNPIYMKKKMTTNLKQGF